MSLWVCQTLFLESEARDSRTLALVLMSGFHGSVALVRPHQDRVQAIVPPMIGSALKASCFLLCHEFGSNNELLRTAPRPRKHAGIQCAYAWGIAGGIQLIRSPADLVAQQLTLALESGPGSHPWTVHSGHIGDVLFRRHR